MIASDKGSLVSGLTPVEVAVSPVEKFQEFLATRGKRLTQERRAIVEAVFSDHEHFDADQLIARLSVRKPGSQHASRSTIYRMLELLEESGLLRKVARTKHGSEVYEQDYGYSQHDHLICKKCGKLIEFHNDAISRILEEVAAQHGFRMTGHRMEVHGVCSECSRPVQRRHRKLEFV